MLTFISITILYLSGVLFSFGDVNTSASGENDEKIDSQMKGFSRYPVATQQIIMNLLFQELKENDESGFIEVFKTFIITTEDFVDFFGILMNQQKSTFQPVEQFSGMYNKIRSMSNPLPSTQNLAKFVFNTLQPKMKDKKEMMGEKEDLRK